MLQIFEIRILRIIYGTINDNGIRGTRYNKKPCTLYDKLDVDKVTKIGRLRWLRHICRMQELDRCRKLTVLKPESTQYVGEPKLM